MNNTQFSYISLIFPSAFQYLRPTKEKFLLVHFLHSDDTSKSPIIAQTDFNRKKKKLFTQYAGAWIFAT